MTDLATSLPDLYHDAADVRAAGLTRTAAEAIYVNYLDFIAAHAPPGRFLDVGCGAGWSTFLAAARGYDSTGVDLNPRAFEPPPGPRLRLEYGSGTDLPFDDESFDAVGAYQTLEHVSDPRQMLNEMVRVTRPGGIVCIVGPNLLSPLVSARAIGWYVWRNRPLLSILLRRGGMPRHPFGNTLPEAVAALGRNLYLIARKVVFGTPEFTLRRPDLRPPFHGDNDAVYLCNPLDLKRHLRECGCQVLRDTALGRPRWTKLITGGTWIAVRKA